MARGWESKSVDDQIAEAADRPRQSTGDPGVPLDPHASKRSVLQLARAKTLRDLQHACDRRHRATLEAALEHLDAELAKVTDV